MVDAISERDYTRTLSVLTALKSDLNKPIGTGLPDVDKKKKRKKKLNIHICVFLATKYVKTLFLKHFHAKPKLKTSVRKDTYPCNSLLNHFFKLKSCIIL